MVIIQRTRKEPLCSSSINREKSLVVHVISFSAARSCAVTPGHSVPPPAHREPGPR
jgi:hypothetical protein